MDPLLIFFGFGIGFLIGMTGMGGVVLMTPLLILVFGILGLVVCFIFGILAWVWGNTDLKAMDAGRMDPTGRGLTQAGRIVGMVSVGLTVVGILFGLFAVLGLGAVAAQ